MKRYNLLFTIIIILLASCSEPNTESLGVSLTARIIDSSNVSRAMIAPDSTLYPNQETTHYRFTILGGTSVDFSDADAVFTYSSELISKASGSFTVDGLVSGYYWRAEAEAIALNDDLETVIGKGESETILLTDNGNLNILIEDLHNATAGDVSIELIMPPGLEDSVFTYAYKISGKAPCNAEAVLSDGVYSYESNGTGTALGGKAKISISGLNQGVYSFSISVSGTYNVDNIEHRIERSGSEIMRLLSGITASGIIHLDNSVSVDEGLGVSDETGTLIDEQVWFYIGDIDQDGKINDLNVYSVVFPISEANESSVDVRIYIDGDEISPDSISSSVISETGQTGVSSGITVGVLQFKDAMSEGYHVIKVLMTDDTPLGAGSYTACATIEGNSWKEKPVDNNQLSEMEQ